MIIEFVGIPGCGKSTAARHIIAVLEGHSIPIRAATGQVDHGHAKRVARHLLRPVRFTFSLLTSPRATVALIQALVRSGRSFAEKWFAFRHVVVTIDAVAQARRQTTPGTVTVFHEGVCQRSFLAFVDGSGTVDMRRLRRFAADIPHSDIIVVLQADPSTALDRVTQRGHGALSHRFDHLAGEDLVRRLREGQKLLNDVVTLVSSRPKHPVLTLSIDSDDLPNALEQLEHELLAILLACD